MRVSAPPFLHPCYFGTDIPTEDQLLAHGRTLEEIRELIGADSLAYLKVERLSQLAEGLPDEEQQPDVSEPASGQSLPYPKPVVPPDPGPAPQTEPEPEAEAESEPAPAARSSTRKKKSNPAPKAPAAQEPAKPAYVLPKAVLGPNEAPCMVDGLDGYAYDYQ